jgi:hypothetical protein
MIFPSMMIGNNLGKRHSKRRPRVGLKSRDMLIVTLPGVAGSWDIAVTRTSSSCIMYDAISLAIIDVCSSSHCFIDLDYRILLSPASIPTVSAQHVAQSP